MLAILIGAVVFISALVILSLAAMAADEKVEGK